MSEKVAFIQAQKANHGVGRLCDNLQISRDAYYKHTARGPSMRSREDENIKAAMCAGHKEHRGVYGVRRMCTLLNQGGVPIGVRRTSRLFKEAGLVAKRRKHKYKKCEKTGRVAENIMNRNFYPSSFDTFWTTDITYLRVSNRWVYLAVFMDLGTREVVSWHVSENIDAQLVSSALAKARLAGRTVPKGLVIHSDQGSTYVSEEYQRICGEMGFVLSMSRKGNCWDNATQESFFSTLKLELDHDHWGTIEALELELFSYIDGFYNTRRLHSSLGNVSPYDFKQMLLDSRRVKENSVK